MLHNHSFVYIFFLGITLIIYFPVFQFTFFQDDYVWISHAKDVWAGNAHIITLRISNFVMPTVYAYFAIYVKLFGLASSWYYLANILLHALNALLIYKITQKILPTNIAFLSSILFLVLRYPLESVSWISAVTVLLTTCFLLLSGLYWLTFLTSKNPKHYILFLLASFMLVFTKEWSILLIPFIIMVHTLFCMRTNQPIYHKKYILYLIPLVGIFLSYGLIELSIQHNTNALITKGYYKIGWHSIPNIVSNILLTFVPLTNLAHTEPVWWLAMSTIILVAGLASGIYIVIKKKNPLVFGIIWMIISFLPTSFFTWDPYVSRYAYIPAIGAALCIGYGITLIQNSLRKQWITRTAIILVILYGMINVLFTYRVLNNLYKPIHEENIRFANALYEIEDKLDKSNDLAIYYDTPHKAFILPEIFHTLINIPTHKVHVIHTNEECTEYNQCYAWNPTKKIIEQL